jgi:hypothetical protein
MRGVSRRAGDAAAGLEYPRAVQASTRFVFSECKMKRLRFCTLIHKRKKTWKTPVHDFSTSNRGYFLIKPTGPKAGKTFARQPLAFQGYFRGFSPSLSHPTSQL